MALVDHTASGQALGYFFQLERAMSWLAKSPTGSVIGIETEDDIVVQLTQGNKIHEQDKSSTTTYPFAASRVDLWKTLLIWLEGAKEGEIDINKTTFYLVTNKVSERSFAELLGNSFSDVEIESCIETIKKYAQKYSGEVKVKIDEVLSYDLELLKKLISKIRYSSGANICGPRFREELVSDLQIVEDDKEIAQSIIDKLFGYVFNEIVDFWRKKEPAYIERDAFMRVKNREISKAKERIFNEKVFYEIGQIDKETVSTQFKSQYIHQIKLIDGNDKVIQDAICDYLNSVKTKTLIARKGYVTKPQLEEMETELKQRWESISELQKIVQSHQEEKHLGRVIYLETMNHNAKLGDVETRGYFLTRGSYHSLADSLTVGWHPDYITLCNKLDDE